MSYTIGIDVGGTKVLGGVVDESGKILIDARRDTPREGGSALTQTIADVARELMASYSVESVGISAAGFVSSDRKTMLATPNIAGWNGVDLDAQSGNKNKEEDPWARVQARALARARGLDPDKATSANLDDITSLTDQNAANAGFGIGMGLDYEVL